MGSDQLKPPSRLLAIARPSPRRGGTLRRFRSSVASPSSTTWHPLTPPHDQGAIAAGAPSVLASLAEREHRPPGRREKRWDTEGVIAVLAGDEDVHLDQGGIAVLALRVRRGALGDDHARGEANEQQGQ